MVKKEELISINPKHTIYNSNRDQFFCKCRRGVV
jgi:hypothetical protein